MEFEDSRFALFSEPNAYIQPLKRLEKEEKKVKKIVFQEPYETLPQFYLNNNFKKHDCDCVQKTFNKYGSNCNHGNQNYCCNHDDHNKKNNCNQNNKSIGFDLKSLLPLLGAFNKGGADISNITKLLSNQSQNTSSNLISTLLSNKDMMSSILNMFKGGGLNINKSKPAKKQLKTTDFEIKNYTRVE